MSQPPGPGSQRRPGPPGPMPQAPMAQSSPYPPPGYAPQGPYPQGYPGPQPQSPHQPVPYPPAQHRRPPHPQPSPSYRHPNEETRRDVEAAWAARLELGPNYEDAIAEGLAERIEQMAAYRTAELRQAYDKERAAAEAERSTRAQRLALGIVSLGAGIPITGIAAGTDLGIVGVAVAWTGIVLVNVAHALGGRRRR